MRVWKCCLSCANTVSSCLNIYLDCKFLLLRVFEGERPLAGELSSVRHFKHFWVLLVCIEKGLRCNSFFLSLLSFLCYFFRPFRLIFSFHLWSEQLGELSNMWLCGFFHDFFLFLLLFLLYLQLQHLGLRGAEHVQDCDRHSAGSTASLHSTQWRS